MNTSTNGVPMKDELGAAKIRLFRNRVREWAAINGRVFPWRRPNQSFYKLLVTEVLLQRTKAEAVAAIYDQFFAKYPDWRDLATADPAEVSQMLRYIGLWKRRPAALIAFAQAVVAHGCELPVKRDELEQLPAVGQYVASAALLFGGVSNEPLVDASMARVLERFFGARKLADIRYDPYLQALAKSVVDADDAVAINWAILDLAAYVCRGSRPKCDLCPLNSHCSSLRRFM